jgi:hypothetical protein
LLAKTERASGPGRGKKILRPEKSFMVVLEKLGSLAAARRRPAPDGAGSNAQCKQHNNTDPDYQHRKRYGIIIEPVSASYTHDATSIPNS